MAEPNHTDKEAEQTMNNTDLFSTLAQSSENLTKDEKALKKKLKKERQKEKKNNEKHKIEVTNGVDSNEITTSVGKKESKEKSKVDDNCENHLDNNNDNTSVNQNDDSGGADIDFSIDAPAFVRSSVVSKNDTAKMSKKINDSSKDNDSVRETNNVLNKVFPDESDGFTCVKKGTKQASSTFNKTPEGFGIQALNVIRVGNFPLAVEYLTRAIALDPTDTRHYINRSYCHLRLSNFQHALQDIKFVSERFSDTTELARAKCREGQALAGLQNYEAAERAFRDCLKLTPNCLYAKRELMSVQIAQMVGMGFNERDAILALGNKPNTTEAIISLSNETSTNKVHYDSTGSATDDEIFQSDDEENPSNESLLSRILNYDPTLLDEPRIPEQPSNKIINNVKQAAPRATSADRGLRVLKTIDLSPKPKSNNSGINEMAIWVGNITAQITDGIMTKRFGKFGKVSLIWRSPSATYCFVNFQHAGAAKKALEEANSNGGNIDVGGNLLPIKPAATKTFK